MRLVNTPFPKALWISPTVTQTARSVNATHALCLVYKALQCLQTDESTRICCDLWWTEASFSLKSNALWGNYADEPQRTRKTAWDLTDNRKPRAERLS